MTVVLVTWRAGISACFLRTPGVPLPSGQIDGVQGSVGGGVGRGRDRVQRRCGLDLGRCHRAASVADDGGEGFLVGGHRRLVRPSCLDWSPAHIQGAAPEAGPRRRPRSGVRWHDHALARDQVFASPSAAAAVIRDGRRMGVLTGRSRAPASASAAGKIKALIKRPRRGHRAVQASSHACPNLSEKYPSAAGVGTRTKMRP